MFLNGKFIRNILLFLWVIASNMAFHRHRKVFQNPLLQGSLHLPGTALGLDSAAGDRNSLATHSSSRPASRACIFVCNVNQSIYELPICTGRATLRSRPAWSLAHLSHHKLDPILWPGWQSFPKISLMLKISKWFYFNLLSTYNIWTKW